METNPEVMEALSNSFKDEEHLKRLLEILSRPPLFTTLRIDLNILPADQAKRSLSLSLMQQSKATGINMFEIFQHSDLKDCLIIPNRGPLDHDKLEKEVIVDLACGMAVLRGAHVFKQGIMGAPVGLENGSTVSVYADMDGKCLKGLTSPYPGRKLHVGNGVMQVSRADLFGKMSDNQRGIGILMTRPVYEAPCLSEISYLWVFAQNLPSMVCVHALDPQPGESVLDMCAAPGGKTAHIAALMQNKGTIIALEKSSQRAKKIEQLQLENVKVYTFDSTKAMSTDTVNRPGSDGPPFPEYSFDRILVDAPCSALGQRPCLINKMTLGQLKSFPVIQHKLLLTAADLLKPGGVLVYSTCTITVEENENQVARLLSKRPDLKLVPMPFKFGRGGLNGCQLTDEEKCYIQRFDPSIMLDGAHIPSLELHNVDTIGFYIAKFVKKLSKEVT